MDCSLQVSRIVADEEWRLLLQVYSDTEADMDWAGSGVTHFGFARADLAAHDFSRVWVDPHFLWYSDERTPFDISRKVAHVRCPS